MEKNHVDINAHSQIRTSQISLGLGGAALAITLVMSGFYISDTITGDTNLRNVLVTLGFCPKLEASDDSQLPVAGEKGDPGETGATGATGSTGPRGPSGTCNYIIDLALVDGNLVPSADNKYTLGTKAFRWKDLQLGPGTLFIEDPGTGKQVAVTVSDGSLLLDGADSLRIGNVRLTAEGIESILSEQDITIGNLGDTGYVVLARGLKFPDGTIQSTAAGGGSAGSQGSVGPQGPKGDPGDLSGFVEQSACVENKDGAMLGPIEFGTCAENKKTGTDIKVLMKLP